MKHLYNFHKFYSVSLAKGKNKPIEIMLEEESSSPYYDCLLCLNQLLRHRENHVSVLPRCLKEFFRVIVTVFDCNVSG